MAKKAVKKKEEPKIIRVSVDVPCSALACMMTSFMESGDPVSSGWCYLVKYRGKRKNWYSNPQNFADPQFSFIISEYADSENPDWRKTVDHDVGLKEMTRGLRVMAKKYPRQFGEIMQENTDAPCADLFMQCCLFGEEKYA
jgi:hypothetical protein